MADKFKDYAGGSEAMVVGKMLHEVFQRVLLRRQEEGAALRDKALKDTVSREIQSVVSTLESLNQL